MEKKDITLYQSPVLFLGDTVEDESKRHTYWLGEQQLQGITGTVLKRALGDPYAAMAGDPVAEDNKMKAAQRGHTVHDDVETLFNFGGNPLTLEGRNCIREFDARGWQHIASEYIVSDEETYASSIDLLFLDEHGDLCIGDIKTYSASTAKAQLQRVALQCAIYNLYFSLHNTYEIKHHYEIRLREQEVDIVELPMINPSIVGELLTACKTGDEKYEYNPTPEWYYDMELELRELLEIQARVNDSVAKMKACLLDRMKQENIKTLRNEYTISVVKGRVTQKVDSQRFQEEHPEKAIDYLVQTFDDKTFKAAAKKDAMLKTYITETVGEETIRIAS